jgi:hypothetical protein
VDCTAVPDASWHDGKTLLGVLDGLKKVERDSSGPVRMPVTDRFKDGGLNVMGKLESGSMAIGDTVIVMPNKVHIRQGMRCCCCCCCCCCTLVSILSLCSRLSSPLASLLLDAFPPSRVPPQCSSLRPFTHMIMTGHWKGRWHIF